MSFLKSHPFPVQAYFETSTVLTFAFPKNELEPFIPHPLQLDTFLDKWAFIAIAMVQTRNLRPARFPKFSGNDFFLIGFRIFVRYTNQKGKNLRGLHILKSQTDSQRMKIMGNFFTHYNYSKIDIQTTQEDSQKIIKSEKSAFEVRIVDQPDFDSIPKESPFTSWKDARRFAGPLPHTFNVNEQKKEITIVKGVRQNWTPNPINVKAFHFDFFDEMNLLKPKLASAFNISNVPYYWEKGYRETWH